MDNVSIEPFDIGTKNAFMLHDIVNKLDDTPASVALHALASEEGSKKTLDDTTGLFDDVMSLNTDEVFPRLSLDENAITNVNGGLLDLLDLVETCDVITPSAFSAPTSPQHYSLSELEPESLTSGLSVDTNLLSYTQSAPVSPANSVKTQHKRANVKQERTETKSNPKKGILKNVAQVSPSAVTDDVPVVTENPAIATSVSPLDSTQVEKSSTTNNQKMENEKLETSLSNTPTPNKLTLEQYREKRGNSSLVNTPRSSPPKLLPSDAPCSLPPIDLPDVGEPQLLGIKSRKRKLQLQNGPQPPAAKKPAQVKQQQQEQQQRNTLLHQAIVKKLFLQQQSQKQQHPQLKTRKPLMLQSSPQLQHTVPVILPRGSSSIPITPASSSAQQSMTSASVTQQSASQSHSTSVLPNAANFSATAVTVNGKKVHIMRRLPQLATTTVATPELTKTRSVAVTSEADGSGPKHLVTPLVRSVSAPSVQQSVLRSNLSQIKLPVMTSSSAAVVSESPSKVPSVSGVVSLLKGVVNRLTSNIQQKEGVPQQPMPSSTSRVVTSSGDIAGQQHLVSGKDKLVVVNSVKVASLPKPFTVVRIGQLNDVTPTTVTAEPTTAPKPQMNEVVAANVELMSTTNLVQDVRVNKSKLTATGRKGKTNAKKSTAKSNMTSSVAARNKSSESTLRSLLQQPPDSSAQLKLVHATELKVKQDSKDIPHAVEVVVPHCDSHQREENIESKKKFEGQTETFVEVTSIDYESVNQRASATCENSDEISSVEKIELNMPQGDLVEETILTDTDAALQDGRSPSPAFYDKLPNYMTSLSVPPLVTPKPKTLADYADKGLPTLDRDPSPDRSDPLMNKVPAYFSVFTNSTKYDGQDDSGTSVTSQSRDEDGAREESRPRSRGSSSRSSSRHHSRERSFRRSRSPSRSRSRSRSPLSRSKDRHDRDVQKWREDRRSNREDEQRRRMRERRIVYVGGLSRDMSRAQLRNLFFRFGDIENVSLHFREPGVGDSYGFITFVEPDNAIRAIKDGKTDPVLGKFDLCFGGRREFCTDRYADLDGDMEEEVEMEAVMPRDTATDDFDELLARARRGRQR